MNIVDDESDISLRHQQSSRARWDRMTPAERQAATLPAREARQRKQDAREQELAALRAQVAALLADRGEATPLADAA